MNDKLAESLVQVGVLIPGVEIEVEYITKGLSGNIDTPATDTFFIRKIFKTSAGKILFDCSSTIAEQIHRFLPSNITKIDGMDPARFAGVYNIAPNGDPKRRGNKRGRKSKTDLLAMMGNQD